MRFHILERYSFIPNKLTREWLATVILWQTGRIWRIYLWITVGFNPNAAAVGQASSRFKWQFMHCILYSFRPRSRSQNCEERLLAPSYLVVRPSVFPHGKMRLQLDGFPWNFVFEYSSKIRRENLSFIKIVQEELVLCTKNNIHFWSHLAQLLSEWEMFQTKVV